LCKIAGWGKIISGKKYNLRAYEFLMSFWHKVREMIFQKKKTFGALSLIFLDYTVPGIRYF
jgi:hypothetical protein